jgi:hypothetical protein
VSEKSVTRQQAGLVRGQKRAVGTPRSRWGLLWGQIRCVEERGRRTMCGPGVQIGNSGIIESRLLGKALNASESRFYTCRVVLEAKIVR